MKRRNFIKKIGVAIIATKALLNIASKPKIVKEDISETNYKLEFSEGYIEYSFPIEPANNYEVIMTDKGPIYPNRTFKIIPR